MLGTNIVLKAIVMPMHVYIYTCSSIREVFKNTTVAYRNCYHIPYSQEDYSTFEWNDMDCVYGRVSSALR